MNSMKFWDLQPDLVGLSAKCRCAGDEQGSSEVLVFTESSQRRIHLPGVCFFLTLRQAHLTSDFNLPEVACSSNSSRLHSYNSLFVSPDLHASSYHPDLSVFPTLKISTIQP